MLTYELAKQLKNAGFKQGNIVITNNKPCDNPNCLKGHKALYCHSAYAPTLEELIEACGDDFRFLGKELNGWEAVDFNFKGFKGSTPEEAVARLWLVLQEK